MSKDKGKTGHCDYCLRCDVPEVLDVQIKYYTRPVRLGLLHKWFAITLCKNCRKYLFGKWRYIHA